MSKRGPLSASTMDHLLGNMNNLPPQSPSTNAFERSMGELVSNLIGTVGYDYFDDVNFGFGSTIEVSTDKSIHPFSPRHIQSSDFFGLSSSSHGPPYSASTPTKFFSGSDFLFPDGMSAFFKQDINTGLSEKSPVSPPNAKKRRIEQPSIVVSTADEELEVRKDSKISTIIGSNAHTLYLSSPVTIASSLKPPTPTGNNIPLTFDMGITDSMKAWSQPTLTGSLFSPATAAIFNFDENSPLKLESIQMDSFLQQNSSLHHTELITDSVTENILGKFMDNLDTFVDPFSILNNDFSNITEVPTNLLEFHDNMLMLNFGDQLSKSSIPISASENSSLDNFTSTSMVDLPSGAVITPTSTFPTPEVTTDVFKSPSIPAFDFKDTVAAQSFLTDGLFPSFTTTEPPKCTSQGEEARIREQPVVRTHTQNYINTSPFGHPSAPVFNNTSHIVSSGLPAIPFQQSPSLLQPPILRSHSRQRSDEAAAAIRPPFTVSTSTAVPVLSNRLSGSVPLTPVPTSSLVHPVQYVRPFPPPPQGIPMRPPQNPGMTRQPVPNPTVMRPPTSESESVQAHTFACNTSGCGKVFPKYSLLQNHLQTHQNSKSKPFSCEMCPQTFSRSHDLKRHYYIHTQEKPYMCKRCNKGFSRRDALRRHERSVQEGKKVHCNVKQIDPVTGLPVDDDEDEDSNATPDSGAKFDERVK